MQIVPIMKNVNFKADNVKKEKKDPSAPWSRKKCIIGGFSFTSAVLDMFITNKITDKIIKNKNICMRESGSYMKISGPVGIAVLAVGPLIGLAFNKFDEKHPNTKVGNFFYKMFNGPKAKIEK